MNSAMKSLVLTAAVSGLLGGTAARLYNSKAEEIFPKSTKQYSRVTNRDS
jgi:hypothetical protein